MIDAYMEVVATTWWFIGYAITAGIMFGMHEPDKGDSFAVRLIGATVMFTVAFFIYPIFLGLFITRFVK